MILRKLKLKNKPGETKVIPDEEIIERFLQSEIGGDRNYDVDLRFALFITHPEPRGLNLAFDKDEFRRVLELIKKRKITRR